ncbi:MAG: hypothetical protein MHM6MM_007170, partial [Cercozoa sp. M6MM]
HFFFIIATYTTTAACPDAHASIDAATLAFNKAHDKTRKYINKIVSKRGPQMKALLQKARVQLADAMVLLRPFWPDATLPALTQAEEKLRGSHDEFLESQ